MRILPLELRMTGSESSDELRDFTDSLNQNVFWQLSFHVGLESGSLGLRVPVEALLLVAHRL